MTKTDQASQNLSSISTPSALQNPESYNQRDVMGLKPVSAWTAAEEQLHKEHNRILQPGFATRSAAGLISDARLIREDWLTDVCCPTPKASLTMNIGKEMVLNYKVSDESLNTECHKVYEAILKTRPNIEKDIEKEINKRVSSSAEIAKMGEEKLAKTNEYLTKNGKTPVPVNEETLGAAQRIVADIERKKITNEVVSKFVKDDLKTLASTLELEPKPVQDKNKDYSFLGAAGSGKSTISRQFLSDEQKKEYVIFATDNYRAFTVPGTDRHEEKSTKDVFTRTQDVAYMVKELVQEELKASGRRPNIIFDAISLDNDMKKMLSKGELISVVAAYSGEPGHVGIVERADTRARDQAAAPADKGRFVNTTALLEGHANASARLLSSIPDNATTVIYNTNVERGAPPVEIGKINTATKVMEVSDLRVMSEFLNKRNLNVEAVNQVDLIYNSKNPLNTLSTHPENKAKTIIDLVPEGRFKPAYTIQVEDKESKKPYIELMPDKDGKVKLNILDTKTFNEKSGSDTIEGALLRSITRQVEKGSLEASFNAAFEKGDKQSFSESAMKIANINTKIENKLNKETPQEYTPKLKNELDAIKDKVYSQQHHPVTNDHSVAAHISPKVDNSKGRG
jgi:hypothetical protein